MISKTAPSSFCPPAVGRDCLPTHCQRQCALEVIDTLLRSPGAVTGDEMDRLLDLRWQLRKMDDPDSALRLFCELRRKMEDRHYLAFFRLRRWMENHLEALVRICPAAEPTRVAVSLKHYCVEAIRRVLLCSALGPDGVLLAPRLEFKFRTGVVAVGGVAVAETMEM